MEKLGQLMVLTIVGFVEQIQHMLNLFNTVQQIQLIMLMLMLMLMIMIMYSFRKRIKT